MINESSPQLESIDEKSSAASPAAKKEAPTKKKDKKGEKTPDKPEKPEKDKKEKIKVSHLCNGKNTRGK